MLGWGEQLMTDAGSPEWQDSRAVPLEEVASLALDLKV